MTRTEKVLVHGSTWLVTASGIAYAWMKYFMRSDDPYSAINHPLQPAALAWHVVVGPLLVFAVGLITQEHILTRVNGGARPRDRRSGLAAALVVVPMILSGYALQVVSEPPLRALILALHLSTSALFFVTYIVHVFLSRAGARSPDAAGEGEAPRGRLVRPPGARRRSAAAPRRRAARVV